MKGLCDEIHGLGLKTGIYSTPWVTSYAGYPRRLERHRGRRLGPATGGGSTASTASRRTTPSSGPRGASTTSSTTGTPTTSPHVTEDGQGRFAPPDATSSTASPTRAPFDSGRVMGRRWPTAGGPPATSATPGAAWPASVSAQDRWTPVRRTGPLERPRHARRRPCGLGPEPAPDSPDAQRAVHAHQPVVPAGGPAADRLRPGRSSTSSPSTC